MNDLFDFLDKLGMAVIVVAVVAFIAAVIYFS